MQCAINKVAGHEFKAIFLLQPTVCAHCRKFIWGLGKRACRCNVCKVVVHKRCCGELVWKCADNETDAAEQHFSESVEDSFTVNTPHWFFVHNFKRPTFCDLCGSMIFGVTNQGLKCSFCELIVHKRCQPHISKTCQHVAKQMAPSGPDPSVNEGNVANELPKRTRRGSYALSDVPLLPRETAYDRHRSESSHPKAYGEELLAAYMSLGSAPSTGPPGMCFEDLKFIRVLDRGTFGKVLLAERKGTDEVYAVKVLKKEVLLRKRVVSYAFREKRMLTLASMHPFLCAMHSCFQTSECLYFAMEYLIGGDLMFQLGSAGHFSERRARFYAAEIVCALQFLHRHRVVYRDVKLRNILLDAEGHCKLADFGICQEGVSRHHTTGTLVGSPAYMAPELLETDKYGVSVDWWALGVLLYEMMTGKTPFFADNLRELFEEIICDGVHFPPQVSNKAMSIIKGLLIKNPEWRLGCVPSKGGESAIRRHPFFYPVNWTAIETRRAKPPCRPKIKSKRGVDNFNRNLRKQAPSMTPTHPSLAKKMNQDEFSGFSFVNREFTPDEYPY